MQMITIRLLVELLGIEVIDIIFIAGLPKIFQLINLRI
jgi:hypothetical protein